MNFNLEQRAAAARGSNTFDFSIKYSEYANAVMKVASVDGTFEDLPEWVQKIILKAEGE